MRASRRSSSLAVLTLAAIVAGCGDGGGSTSIEANATNFEYDPAVWTVTSGDEFTIAFTNEAGLDHDWVVLNAPITSEADLEPDNILLQVVAETSGGSTIESSTIDNAGTYQVICTIPRHFNGGMEGELTVE